MRSLSRSRSEELNWLKLSKWPSIDTEGIIKGKTIIKSIGNATKLKAHEENEKHLDDVQGLSTKENWARLEKRLELNHREVSDQIFCDSDGRPAIRKEEQGKFQKEAFEKAIGQRVTANTPKGLDLNSFSAEFTNNLILEVMETIPRMNGSKSFGTDGLDRAAIRRHFENREAKNLRELTLSGLKAQLLLTTILILVKKGGKTRNTAQSKS